MGRISFITLRVGLSDTGYEVRVSVHSKVEVIHRERYDRLSWREAQQVCDALADTYRPGLELLHGGTQLDLF